MITIPLYLLLKLVFKKRGGELMLPIIFIYYLVSET